MRYFILLLIALFTGCESSSQREMQVSAEDSSMNSSSTKAQYPLAFQTIWDEISSDKLTTLPHNEISYASLFDGAIDLITQNAKRTLEDRRDLLPYFNKLAHPNGICLKGLWQIDKDNPYGGYFKKGSQALVIARASTAMSNTKQGSSRAFGLAIKLFASTNPLHVSKQPTANIFTIEDLGGSDATTFTSVSLSNEPPTSVTLEALRYALYALKVAGAFEEADVNAGIRQLYEVAYLGEDQNSTQITPKWIKISYSANQMAINANDFRDEFVFDNNRTMRFDIAVSSTIESDIKLWQNIGTITFSEAVVSTTCDHRLHFHHPKFINNI